MFFLKDFSGGVLFLKKISAHQMKLKVNGAYKAELMGNLTADVMLKKRHPEAIKIVEHSRHSSVM